MNAISGVEPPRSASSHSLQPKAPAPAPTLARNTEAGSEIERSASESATTDSQMSEAEVLHTDQPKTDKSLLALRQQYKKNRTNIARVASHLGFLQQCKHQQKTPRGLQVHVRCNALLSDYTDIKEQFKTTKDMAEEEFIEHLKEHYELVATTLREELKTLEANIEAKLEEVSDEEKKEHLELMKKTTDNIAKHEERLKDRKKDKYERLSNNEGPRRKDRTQRRQERPKSRGMPYNTKSSRQPNRPTNRPKTTAQPVPMDTQSTLPPAPNVVQEMAEMRSMLNKLLLSQPPQHIQQPPQLPGMLSHCPPIVQQHPSLLGPGGNALPGQHPSLVRQGQQYFPLRDRLPMQQP